MYLVRAALKLCTYHCQTVCTQEDKWQIILKHEILKQFSHNSTRGWFDVIRRLSFPGRLLPSFVLHASVGSKVKESLESEQSQASETEEGRCTGRNFGGNTPCFGTRSGKAGPDQKTKDRQQTQHCENGRVAENPQKPFPQAKEMDYHVDEGVDKGGPSDEIEEAKFRSTTARIDIGHY